MTKRPKPIVLTVLDGWGYRAETKGNAIALARKPNYDRLLKDFPNTLIHTSGPSVGLPEGQMGNSEVGHLNIGAGRIVQMDITRVDQLIASGEFFASRCCSKRWSAGATRQLHLMGLRQRRRRAFAHRASFRAAAHGARKQSPECFRPLLHGRPRHAARKRHRFSAPARAEDARVRRRPDRERSAAAITRWTATIAGSASRKPTAPMVHGDSEVKFDRPDRRHARELRKGRHGRIRDSRRDHHEAAPGKPAAPRGPDPRRRCRDLLQFPRRPRPADDASADRAGLRQIRRSRAAEKSRVRRHDAVRKNWPWLRYLLAPEKLEHILANVFAELEFKNLRIAETEKYAHVTYFFNGGVEKPFPGEERVLVPSPKVPTYDLKPEMSAAGIADARGSRHRERRLRRHHHEFRQCGHGRPFGQARSRPSRPSKRWTHASGRFFRRCARAAERGSSPPIMATPKR